MPDLPHRARLAISAHAADRTREHALPAVPYGYSDWPAPAERVPAGLHSVPHEYPRLEYRPQVLQVMGRRRRWPIQITTHHGLSFREKRHQIEAAAGTGSPQS